MSAVTLETRPVSTPQEVRTRGVIFALVSFFTWLVYFKTTAPTVVFWDVGEFLATSYILGIPHPPGTPLYVILGKLMTLLPLPMSFLYKIVNPGAMPVEAVLRITSIAMVTGALTAGFIYLLTVKIIELWRPQVPKHLIHLSGIFAALIGAFARTVWMNSIEAETYTPSTFVIAFVSWIALNWWEKKDHRERIKYLLFALYVLFLSSGIHLTPLILLPALFVFVWMVQPELIWDLEFMAVVAVTFLLLSMLGMSYEPGARSMILMVISYLVLVYYLYLKKGRRLDINELGVLAFLILSVLALFAAYRGMSGLMGLAGLLSVVALYAQTGLHRDWKGFALILILIAFSVEFFMMVRAAHPLRINEADPSSWKAFWDSLLRKQYEPMKLFPRRIPFTDQLALYWRYLSWQYPFTLLVPLVLLFSFGFITHYLNEKKSFALIGGLFLLASLGLILYLNLKDSPSQPINPANPREVRDRDYFFAVSYTYFGLFAGLGLFEALRLTLENLRIKAIGKYIGYPVAALILGYQFVNFYPQIDRSHNYIAEDYAYNMLISPAPKSVMYTNGDNDTFPLWFDQEVLGVRKGVIIANLSLLNTNWYCKQLKSWGAPISFSYEQLDSIIPGFRAPDGRVIFLKDIMIRDMIATSSGYQPKEYVTIPFNVRVPRIYVEPADKFLNEVIKGAHFKVPIYFAITVSGENYRGWQEYLEMEGLAFRLRGEKVGERGMEGINAEKTRYLLHMNMPPDSFLARYAHTLPPDTLVFRYRGVFNPKVYKDETHEKLIRNYASVAIRLGLYYDEQGMADLAAQEFELGKKFLNQLSPQSRKAVSRQIVAINMRLGELYRLMGRYEKAIQTYQEALEIEKFGPLYKALGDLYAELDSTEKAIQYYKLAESTGAVSPDLYQSMIEGLLNLGDTGKAESVLKVARQRFPNAPGLDTLLPRRKEQAKEGGR